MLNGASLDDISRLTKILIYVIFSKGEDWNKISSNYKESEEWQRKVNFEACWMASFMNPNLFAKEFNN